MKPLIQLETPAVEVASTKARGKTYKSIIELNTPINLNNDNVSKIYQRMEKSIPCVAKDNSLENKNVVLTLGNY